MSALDHALTAYDRAASTMPPLRQIVLLYDGAITRIREAQAAIERGRVGERAAATGKAAAIVEALAAALDHERGGVIATNLEQLYGDLAFRLHRLALEPDAAVCDALAARLQELRDAWAELAARPAGGSSQTLETSSGAAAACPEPRRGLTA